MTLRYTDIDPNVIELISRKLQTPLENLIEQKLQRRQQWGPTFKQEDIAELALSDADFVIPAPEYGKRVFRFSGAGLTAQRIIRVPPLPSAWWIVHNRASQPLQFLTDPAGTVGPVVPADQVGAIYTDGVGVWQFACCGGADLEPGGEEMPPGGGGTNIQYRLSATTFGGVGGSSVSGIASENVLWQGTHAMSKAGDRSFEWFIDPAITGSQTYLRGQQFSTSPSGAPVIEFMRGRGTFLGQADVVAGDIVGQIQFRCLMSGSPMLCGAVEATHDGVGGTIAIGHVEGGFYANGDHSIGLYQGTPEKSLELLDTGFKFSHGINNSVFYQDASGFFVPVPAGTSGQVLTLAGGIPVWGTAAGASFPSLNQVTDPTAAKAFGMGNHQLLFQFAGTDVGEDSMVIESADGAPGTGVVLLVKTGTSSTKAPFRVSVGGALGPTVLGVNSGGSVGVGNIPPTFSTDTGYKLNVFGNQFITADLAIPSGRALEVERISNTFGGSGSASFFAQETGTFPVGGIYTNVSVVTHSAFSGTAGTDVRGVTSSMINDSVASNPPRLRSFAAYFDSSASLDIAANGSYTAYFAPTLSNGQFYSGSYRGLYLQFPGDIWTNNYGVIAESGFLNGFGTSTPLATLHAAGTVKFDLTGSNVRGDIYYRDASSYLKQLPISTTVGQVLTVTDMGGGAFEPRWAAAAGGPGGGTPGSPIGSLQYNSGGTAFGGITGTAFSGTTISLGSNKLTLGATTSFIDITAFSTGNPYAIIHAEHVSQRGEMVFQRSRASLANVVSGDIIGQIRFEARLAGAWDQSAQIQSFYSSSTGGNLRLQSGNSTRLDINQSSGTFLIVHTDLTSNWTYEFTGLGTRWTTNTGTHGVQGAIYYVGSGNLQKALQVGTVGYVLTVVDTGGGILEPQWAASTGSGGGISSTGGSTNAIQYKTGTTSLGGINTITGMLVANGTGSVAGFVTTLPATRFTFSVGTTAGVNVGQGASDPSALNSTNGDIFYSNTMNKFRVRQNSTWVDMVGTGGTGSPGGATNSVQYNTGSGFGGVDTSQGVLIASGSGVAPLFSNTFSGRMFFSPGASATGLNVGSRSGHPSSPMNGDIFYETATNKFRAYQGGAWVDMIGGTGSVSPPVAWSYTAVTNQPTFFVDHTQQGPASTVANVYGEVHWFRHLHSGAVSDGRRGFTFAWDHQSSGTGTSTNGDIVIEVYATNSPGMGLGSYSLTGFTIGTFFNSTVGMFTGMRIKGANATTRYALVIENGAGDVVLNAAAVGGSPAYLATNASYGYLMIPACNGLPTGSPSIPLGTCALVYRADLNQLYANDGGGWVLV